jgi:hypothetical protein
MVYTNVDIHPISSADSVVPDLVKPRAAHGPIPGECYSSLSFERDVRGRWPADAEYLFYFKGYCHFLA